MNDDAIKRIICSELATLAPESDPTSLAPDANVREALDIDSYDVLQLLIRLSDTLGVDVPESDYDKVTTLDGMVRYLAARVR